MAGKLKINNEKSKFQVPETSGASFEEQIQKAEKNNSEMNSKALDLGFKINEIFKDRTLTENKSEISKKLEGQVIKDLQNLTMQLNSDHAQPECMGSIAAEAIIFGLLFKFRDRINTLEYKIECLEKEFKNSNSIKLEKK